MNYRCMPVRGSDIGESQVSWDVGDCSSCRQLKVSHLIWANVEDSIERDSAPDNDTRDWIKGVELGAATSALIQDGCQGIVSVDALAVHEWYIRQEVCVLVG